MHTFITASARIKVPNTLSKSEQQPCAARVEGTIANLRAVVEPPRAAMSAPRVGRCLRCDMELPLVAFSRSQQNKLRAKKPATCIGCSDNRPSPEELEQQQKARVAAARPQNFSKLM